MSDETWNRYCEKLEELRRVQDEARKRRKESPAVEVINKSGSVFEGVAVAGANAAPGASEDYKVGIFPKPPVP